MFKAIPAFGAIVLYFWTSIVLVLINKNKDCELPDVDFINLLIL